MIKEFENIVYISRPATNKAMCKPGEITSVNYYKTDEPCKNGTVRFYYTDGWSQCIAGRYHPSALRAIGEKLLNKDMDAGEELFNEWCKNNKK